MLQKGSNKSSRVNRKTSAATSPGQVTDHSTCRVELHRVVNQIEPQRVRQVVDTVFTDLLELLERLGQVGSDLHRMETVEETFGALQAIRDEAWALVDFIRSEALNSPLMRDKLIDTLNGITFAVSHDLMRVFESEDTVCSDRSPQIVIPKLYRAHDILTNCLQQSTITLALVFDAELCGARLFNNSDVRFRQSLRLCTELTTLVHLTEACLRDYAGARKNLSVGLNKFRNESLECLMYSDWPQFESFCERVNLIGMPRREFETLLHQFRYYLETLLNQVKMRAVLAKVFPPQMSAPTPFSSSTNSQEQDSAWDKLLPA
jgi:hypothetical protein